MSRIPVSIMLGAVLLTPASAQQAPPPDQPQPVFTDKQFTDALPALPPESKPPASPEVPAKEPTAIPPMPAPASLPALDPALGQPLPSLEQFAAQPFAATSPQDATGTVDVRYTWQLSGVDGLAIAPDVIRKQFATLSALAKGRGKAANAVMIGERLKEDADLLNALLVAEGYFDAQTTTSITPFAPSAIYVAVLSATPGPRYKFGNIAFDVPPLTPPDLVEKNFRPKRGDPIVTEDLLAAEANLSLTLPQNGYPFAKLGARDVLLDPPTMTGAYTLPITPGKRSSFGQIVTHNTAIFDAHHIGILARFHPGDLYDSRKVDDLRKALVATGLLATVAVEPIDNGHVEDDGTAIADLVVDQSAGPAHSLAASAGYETGRGLSVDGSWTHRNLLPSEGAVILAAVAGTEQLGLNAIFRRSNAGQRDRVVDLTASTLYSNFAAYRAYTGEISGHISRVSTPIWQKPITYSLGFELLASNELAHTVSGTDIRHTYLIGALPLQLGLDKSNDLLDPTKGYRVTIKLSPEASLGTGARGYLRSTLEATGYIPFGTQFVLAGRIRASSVSGIARDDLAPSRRLYGGGGGSVRGFGYQQLGPKDPLNNPVGGRSLTETAVEVRYRFGNFGIVGFVDGGQVYESVVPKFDHWRLGAGVGARLYTSFGPLRFDIATPIARQAGESRVAVYVSIGQAF